VNAHLTRVLFWLVAIAAVLYVFALLQGVLMPFAVGFVLAYLLVPLVDRVEGWHIPRGLASLIVLIAFLFAVSLVFVLLVPLVQQQVSRIISRMPNLVAVIQEQFGNLIETVQRRLPAAQAAKLHDLVTEKIGDVVGWAVGLLQGMITGSFAVLSIVSLLVVTPVATFFLMRDWHLMVGNIDAHLPRAQLGTIREQACIIDDTLHGFVHGQAFVCLILAVYYATALWLAGLESALAVGLLIGVLAIIPVVGATIGFALSASLAILQYGTWTSILIVCGIFALGQAVEANILTPKLVGDRIHLHPVWVIFALLAGGKLYGFAGVLISVPAAAVIGVLVRFALDRYRRSPIYDPRQPEAPRRVVPFE